MRRMTDALILSLYLVSASPSLANTYGEAANTARRAYLLTESGKGFKDRIERKGKYFVHDYLGLDKEDAVYFIWAAPLITGSLSTRPLKNVGWKGENWTLRPEIEYRFNHQDKFTGTIVLDWSL